MEKKKIIRHRAGNLFMDPSTPRDSNRQLLRSIALGIFILFILASIPILLSSNPSLTATLHPASTGTYVPASPFTPVFTDPAQKLRKTADPAFTRQLFGEAVLYEPLLNTSGTQVNMGFWSGRGNHGSLVFLLDAINDMPPGSTPLPQKAIWDEGATTSGQYPSYVTMNNEHWYERAASTNGTVIIYGRPYQDPYTVTLSQADDIWGQYSQRYADMAELIRNSTGNPVNVWCFVEGARANRVFYKYELPSLRKLEQKGVVRVYFAKMKTANWTRPGDWTVGTANAPFPSP